MKKKFRVVKNDLSKEGKKAFKPLWYRIEERYTILFFIHWWGTPSFPPPHNFNNPDDAVKYIWENRPGVKILINLNNDKRRS